MRELFSLFLRLGFTAFGGPAAHIAMMRNEVVVKRAWVSEQEFLDMLGACNLIPGPTSTEMAHHIGYLRAGWRGMLVAGISFIVPAMLIVMVLAFLYVQYSTVPQVEGLLYGIKPVVIAIIVQALWLLGRQAMKSLWLVVLGLLVLSLYLLGVNEIVLLIGCGLLLLISRNIHYLSNAVGPIGFVGIPAIVTIAAQPFGLGALFLTFLKIGSVLYGSGYVLLAFLRADFVERLGWLTDQQLIDAIAIGQFTPGPLFTTATFIGYVLGGVPASLLASLGIFLPSFIFVVITHRWIVRLRKSSLASAFLDGVNVAALALMAAVTWQLAQSSIVDPLTFGISITALLLIFRFRVNSAWLVAGGALTGLISSLIG
jgi:chromate transporter